MQPRLRSSRKWTPLPAELVEQIQSVFHDNFQQHIKGGTVEAGGRIYPEEILVVVGFRPEGVLKQNNFEVSIGYRRDKDNVLKLLHLAVDAVGSLFDQFFNSEKDHDFPRIWQEVQFEKRSIYVQYTTTNTELENEANKLLGLEEGEELVGGEWEDEVSPEQIKAQLGIDEESEDFADDEPEEKPKKSTGKKKPTQH